ncbi:hybrid sensor histidine kinase/response regulator [Variovorax sp. JS1663]|uniref:hybrid sensor histidine kinase/response regulator n=1 Tax=Variovorax sp. JS1663 TaxID=1851577 RepID=UPI000B347C99|nr:hybrid sensor histidine kinase/response regulator [Variovorax sp. JS1663]OUM01992.1 hybrid sensor histidine kinase/response regulator [Variovorax sp. JS1663]
MSAGPSELEQRILLRSATSRDATVAAAVLERAQFVACTCVDMAALARELGRGAGAILLAEEVMDRASMAELAGALAAQEPWSDMPVIVLARQGADSRAVATAMDEVANVTVIERPMRVAALVSAVRTALRARRRQYEMRTLLAGLRDADQRKTEFLATLAHELRNPLAPLSTALSLLARKQPVPEEAVKYYELMSRQVEHMVRLVNDLMEVSRITRGKIELHLAPVRLDAVIDDAIELSRPAMERAGHALELEVSGEPLVVRGDAVRLTQVFSNLLNNAAKYTPAGGRVKVVAQQQQRQAVVEVSDTGAGLAPGMLKSIFDMFVQVSGTAKEAQGGLGIGLTLVRSLVELHGGTVEAASEGMGRGATFTVRLPLSRNGAAPAGPRRALSQDGWAPVIEATVLVVDDNRDAADSLAELLRTMGATVLVAYGGEEALRLASAQRVEIAVLDIGMPGMDGCELARRLRARRDGAAMKLFALTGWGQQGYRERIAAAGFDHHLLKPLNLAEFMGLL